MGKMGGLSTAELKKFQKHLSKLQKSEVDRFVDSCAKELAARLLAKVIQRTPTGKYPHNKGKVGGTLKRGWTAKTHEEAASGTGKGSVAAGKAYADSLTVQRNGSELYIEIVNPVEYASYVEFGHRKANRSDWVPGQFMLTISEQEIQNVAPKVLESKIKRFLGDCMK